MRSNRSNFAMQLQFQCVHDPEEAGRLAELFCDALDPAYISHGEIECGRALAPGRWAPEFRESIKKEFVFIADQDLDFEDSDLQYAGPRLLRLEVGGECIGVAVVVLYWAANQALASLEDLVLRRDCRGKGFGRLFLQQLQQRLQRAGIQRWLLEVGGENEKAQAFFQSLGFRAVSVAYWKACGTSIPPGASGSEPSDQL
ncbi:MAG: GNAT family N-acetyltransferase [Planctomycetota bacterium]|nr:MAG: GNAT family N-acetyltransferase [Planctomycetota bacterium]